MKITVLGTRGEIEERSPTHSKHSGVLIDKILFDLGEKEYLTFKPKAIFITHLHPDHAYFVKEKEAPELIGIPIYAPESWTGFSKEHVFKKLKKTKPVRIDNFTITPVPTIHSRKVKSCGFLIEYDKKRIFYSGDMIWIKKQYHNLLKDLDLVITDGSFLRKGGMIRRDKETGEIYGHQGIPNLVEFWKKLGAKHIVFTHFGSWMIDDPEKGKQEIKEFSSDTTKVEAASDGLVISLEEGSNLGTTTTETIEPVIPKVIAKLQPKAGIYLVKPHAQMIAEGKKTLIVKSKKFTAHIGEPLYLLEDKLCWGIITLKEPYEISAEEFEKLRDRHQITDEEAFKRWGWQKDAPLYAYEFEIEEIFDPPLPVKIPKGVQVFVDAKNIKFVDLKTLTILDLFDFADYALDPELYAMIAEELFNRNLYYSQVFCLIKGWIEDYDPSKPNDRQLGDDFRICVKPDTPVITDSKIEFIKDVQPSPTIKEVLKRKVNEKLVKIKPRYLLPVSFTKNHPIFVLPLTHSRHNGKVVPQYKVRKLRNSDGTFNWAREEASPCWKEAGEIKHFDGVAIKKLPEIKTPYPPELFELAGWYLAEGYPSGKYSIRYSLNLDEEQHATRILELFRFLSKKQTGNWKKLKNEIRVQTSDKNLNSFLIREFGHGARNKTLPTWVLYAEKEKVQRLLDAFFAGDGWRTNGYLKTRVASKKLILGLWLLLSKFGKIASLREAVQKTNFGSFRTFELSLARRNRAQFYEDEEYFWLPVVKIEEEQYDGEVWNLETETHDYAVPFRVHNCLAWYSSIRRGKKLFKRVGEEKKEITLDDCKQLALKIFKEMIKRGFTFNKPETYKKYARELFEWLIEQVGEENVPWKEKEEKAKTVPQVETIDVKDLEDIDDVYVKQLTDEQLLKLHSKLHDLFKKIGKVTEPLQNAHIFVWNEMRHRKLKHFIEDDLDRETSLEVVEYPEPEEGVPQKISQEELEAIIKLEQALNAFPDKIIVEEPIHVYLCGRIVNEGQIPASHDIDILFKQGWYHVPTVETFLNEVSKKDPEIAKRLHFVWDALGPHIGFTIPLYRLAFIKVSPEEMKRTSPFAFLAETPTLFKPYVGLKPKCYSEDTEVLTRQGWKKISEVTLHDEVATLKDGYWLQWNKPLRKFEYDWNGPLVHFKGRYIDLLVTPEHKMYVKEGFKRSWSFKEAKDLLYNFFRIKRNMVWDSRRELKEFLGFNGNDFLYLLGLYLAEGHCRHRISGGWEISLALFDEDLEKEITSLLSKYGIKVHKYRDGVLTFWSETLGKFFIKLGNAKSKFIPTEFKDLKRDQLFYLFKGLYSGDGSKRFQRFTTTSKQLADDFLELALRLGYSGQISTYKGNYYVYFGDRHRPRVNQAKNAELVDYKGKVYCLEVPNHLLFVRRNGKPLWCGNSGFEKNEFWDINEMWEKWAKNYIDRGIIIQKKYDGMRFQIHCKGNQVKIITEDRQRDRAPVFKKSVEELLKNKKADSFIIDAEMVEYACTTPTNRPDLCEPIPRENMIKWIGAEKKELDDEYVVFHVHDCVYLNGEALNMKGYEERWAAIDKIFPPNLKHWKKVEGEIAKDMRGFFRLAKKYRSLPGSEGIVAKAAGSTYPIKYSGENRTAEWAKLKNLKEIDVMVWKVIQKKTKEGKPLPQYMYECVFSIPCKDKEKYRERDLVEIGGKCYLWIGRTYATAEKVSPGTIIVVRPIRIAKFTDEKGKIYYSIGPDRVIPIKDSQGIHLLTCQELFERVPGPIITLGEHQVKKIEHLETLAWDGKQSKWTRLLAISRHKTDGKLLRLTQKVGETEVTPGHSLLDKHLNPKEADTNPVLFGLRSIPPIGEEEEVTISLPGYIRKRNRLYLRPSGHPFSKTENYSSSKNWVLSYYRGKTLFALMRVLGAYCSEGSLGRNGTSWRVRISNKDKTWLENLAKDVKLISSATPNWEYNNRGKTWNLVFWSRPLHDLLFNLCGKGARNKTVPPFLFKLKQEYRDAFHEQLSKGDGTNGKGLTSKSLKLIGAFCLLCALKGTNFSVSRTKDCIQIREVKYQTKKPPRRHKKEYVYKGWTYDLQTEEGNFVDSCGLVLCKNTWMFPYYDGKHPAKKEPDSIDVVEKLVKIGTGPAPEQLGVLIFRLPECPFWNDDNICPLKSRFRIPRDMLTKVKIEYLKYPIVCRFANHYRCRFVKSYYYGFLEGEVKEVDEDTGEEINENN